MYIYFFPICKTSSGIFQAIRRRIAFFGCTNALERIYLYDARECLMYTKRARAHSLAAYENANE